MSALRTFETLLATAERTSTGCLIWPGRIDERGYGRYSSGMAHREAYQTAIGPIPEGMHVDHVCFTPACVEPSHLRVLTPLENTRRQRSALAAYCVNGHEYTPENTYIRPRRHREGRRDCRTCIRDRVRRYRARKAQTRELRAA